MRRFIFTSAVFAFATIALACASCGKETVPTSDNPPPTKEDEQPAPKPKAHFDFTEPVPAPRVVDPANPDLKIDLARFSSALPANDPAVKDWMAKNGKTAEVVGVMGSIFVNSNTGHENFFLKAENGPRERAIGCDLQVAPDWRIVSPGRNVKVVGFLDVKDHGSRGIDIRLVDAVIVAVWGNKLLEVSAQQLGKEFAADNAAFEKKWTVEDRFYYVTGVLKRVDTIPLSKTTYSYKYVIAAGAVDLYCHVQNERGVIANPPEEGEKVTLLMECLGYSPGFRAVAMAGVYVGKAR
jgi:hypothetical protein